MSSIFSSCEAKETVVQHLYLFIAQEKGGLQYFFPIYFPRRNPHFHCLQRLLGIDLAVQQDHTLNFNDCKVLEGIAKKSIILIPRIIYL